MIGFKSIESIAKGASLFKILMVIKDCYRVDREDDRCTPRDLQCSENKERLGTGINTIVGRFRSKESVNR